MALTSVMRKTQNTSESHKVALELVSWSRAGIRPACGKQILRSKFAQQWIRLQINQIENSCRVGHWTRPSSTATPPRSQSGMRQTSLHSSCLRPCSSTACDRVQATNRGFYSRVRRANPFPHPDRAERAQFFVAILPFSDSGCPSKSSKLSDLNIPPSSGPLNPVAMQKETNCARHTSHRPRNFTSQRRRSIWSVTCKNTTAEEAEADVNRCVL
jgi:hypothetical protein